MSEDTARTPVAETFVCPVDDCRALIPDTLDDRRAHRRGHEHRDKVDEAIRTALRLVRTDFGNLRGETRDAIKKIHDEVAGIDRAVGQIEIPEQQPPMQINRGGWDDDELDEPDQPTATEPDPWAELTTPVETDSAADDQPISTYANDDLAYPDTRADASAAFTRPELA